MSDWTEAAVDTAIRDHAARQPAPLGPTTVRVSAAVNAEIERRQAEFAAANPGAGITKDGVIAAALADRKQATP